MNPSLLPYNQTPNQLRQVVARNISSEHSARISAIPVVLFGRDSYDNCRTGKLFLPQTSVAFIEALQVGNQGKTLKETGSAEKKLKRKWFQYLNTQYSCVYVVRKLITTRA